ncbi:MAG: FecR domain-containing protein [Acidobacteria bacterium]|nr:FecR domain-containing protein [Acidobacteriota bacterium]
MSADDADRECERCWELADRNAAGALDATETAAWREHLRSCPACAADAALAGLAADLVAAGPSANETADRERWVNGVLKRAAAGGRIPTRARTFSAIVAIGAVALAAAVVTAFLVVPGSGSHDSRGGTPGGAARTAEVSFVAGSARVERAADRRLAELRPGDSLRPGDAIEVGVGRVGLRWCGGADLHLDAATRVRLEAAETASCTVRLESGRVVANAHGLARGSRLVVSTASGDVRVKGTVFAVEVVGADAEVRVLEGAVEVLVPSSPVAVLRAPRAMRLGGGPARTLTVLEIDRDRRLASIPGRAEEPVGARVAMPPATDSQTGPETALEPGPSRVAAIGGAERPAGRLPGPAGRTDGARVIGPAGVRGTGSAPGAVAVGGAEPLPTAGTAASDPVAPPAAPTPRELLDAARRLRIASDWPGAAAAYEELVARHPDSGEAHVALVPLGQLRLERLDDAAGALRAFDDYLRQDATAPLAEEASWGRIESLRRLGRPAEEADALRGFLAEHPASLRLGEARRRLAELGVQP